MRSCRHRDLTGLVKLAQYFSGVPSVGEVMNRVNADMTLPTYAKRDFVSRVNDAGLTVNQPAFRLPYLFGGAVAGHSLAKYMGAKPFWDGVYTLGGAMYGNSMFNKSHPKPKQPWQEVFQ